jgi:hypothetical protein
MIVFDLACRPGDHRFEGWFASSADYASQQKRGIVCCPECGSPEVEKAAMAPSVGRKGNQLAVTKPAKPQPMASGPLPAEAAKMMQALAKMQGEALKQSRWVGDTFAEKSREMHYGERDQETIHGQATLKEAKDLHEEGIAVMPLPFPVAPPDETN